MNFRDITSLMSTYQQQLLAVGIFVLGLLGDGPPF